MNVFLLASANILNTAWGMALFILLDIAVLLLIIGLNYRWLFKRLLDIVFAVVFLVVFFVFFLLALLAQAIYNKVQNAYKTLFVSEYIYGKKGKILKVTTFATYKILHDADGKLLPQSERITGMGKFLKATGLKYYPCLVQVLAGGLSFVGPKPMAAVDGYAVGEEAQARFSVRPGLVSSLERFGGEGLTYPDLFEEDLEYVAHISLWKDFLIFMAKIANRLRGDSTRRLGECTETGYVDWLIEAGQISSEEAAQLREEGEKKLRSYAKQQDEKKDFQRVDFGNFHR